MGILERGAKCITNYSGIYYFLHSASPKIKPWSQEDPREMITKNGDSYE
jgi:hypothetical protein|tara:strand:+ start:1375 stop:1521 length:147 start_codon:yes stop_codon:yes gene_type:complete